MATHTETPENDKGEEEGPLMEAWCSKCDLKLNIRLDRFKDDRYKNWIKASLCMQCTKEGLHNFVAMASAEFYKDVKPYISRALGCTSCTYKKMQGSKNECSECKPLKTKIETSCKNKHPPTWSNTTLKEMEESHNNVAKLFMPTHCKQYKNPEQGDCTALLSFMEECTVFEPKFLNQGVIQWVRKSRNDIMHSGTMLIENPQLEELRNRCVTLLSDGKLLSADKDCQKAIEEIKKIIGNSVHIDLVKAEESALHEHSKHVNGQLDEFKELIKSSDTPEAIDEVKTKLKKLEEQVIKNKVIVEFYHIETDTVDNLETEASDLYQQAEQKKEKIVTDTIQAKSDELKVQVNELTKNSDKEKSQIKRLKTNVEAEQQKINELKQDLDKQKELARKLEEDKRAREMEEENQAKYQKRKSDLRGYLCKRYTNMCKCSPIHNVKPFFEGPEIDLYVKHSLEVVDSRRIGTNRQNIISDTVAIFCKDGHVFHDICIYGGQGVGKSALCNHLATVWSDPLSISGISKLTSAESKEMQKFVFLFYIQLNGHALQTIDDLVTLIQTQLELEHFDVKDFLSKEPTLILLDSMVETKCMTAIRQCLHSQSVIIQTTMPNGKESKIERVKTKFDRELTITGLANDSANELIEKTIDRLNTEYNTDRTGTEFMLHTKDSLNVKQVLNEPLLLVQMVCLWHDHVNSGKSEYDRCTNMIHHQFVAAAKAQYIIIPNRTAINVNSFLFRCDVEKCVCHSYVDLLWRVSEAAYNSILRNNQEQHDQFNKLHVQNLSETDIETCLKTGIIKECAGSMFKFAINMYKEYFASVFLCKPSKEVEMQKLFDTEVFDLNRTFEFGKMLLSNYELDDTVVRRFSRILMEKVNKNDRVQEYRASCDRKWNAPNADLVKNVQSTILTAGRQLTGLHLHDVRLYGADIQDIQKSIRPETIKTVFVSSPKEDGWKLLLKTCHGLKKVVLNNCKMGSEEIRETVKSNNHGLETFGLYGKDIDVKSLGNDLFEVLSLRHLTSLGLGRMTLTHEQIQLICSDNQSVALQLKEIQYRFLKCNKHGYSGEECNSELDLTKKKSLCKLTLCKVPACIVRYETEQLNECLIKLGDVSAQISALGCLTGATNLHSLECIGFHNVAVIDLLLQNLKSMINLRKLVLQCIEFGDVGITRPWNALGRLELLELSDFVISNRLLSSLMDILLSNTIQIMLYSGRIEGNGKVLREIRTHKSVTLEDDDVHYDHENRAWVVNRLKYFTKHGY